MSMRKVHFFEIPFYTSHFQTNLLIIICKNFFSFENAQKLITYRKHFEKMIFSHNFMKSRQHFLKISSVESLIVDYIPIPCFGLCQYLSNC